MSRRSDEIFGAYNVTFWRRRRRRKREERNSCRILKIKEI